MHIFRYLRLFLLFCGAVFSVLMAIRLLLPGPDTAENARPQDESPATFGKPNDKDRKEQFKRNARKIGGETFSPPAVKDDEIIRLPSSQPSPMERKNLAKEKAATFTLTRPIVVDINTISSGKITVIIADIEAVPVNKTCNSAGKALPCGRMARTALRALIRGRTLNCQAVGQMPPNEEITTSCSVGKTDIGQWLVDQGWTKSTVAMKP